MNEFLKSFTSPFAERVKSPIVGPFIVSWCAFNWKVLYITLFVGNEFLKPSNKLEEVSKLLYWHIGFVCPLAFTLIYIFCMPWVERQIISITEKQKQKNLEKKLEIAKKFVVDGSKYYKLLENYEEEKMKIAEYESKVAAEKEKAVLLQTEKDGLQNHLIGKDGVIAKMQDELTNLRSRNDITKFFTGRWQSFIEGKLVDEIEFEENKYIVTTSTGKFHAFDILGFDIDIKKEEIKFLKYNREANNHCYNALKIIDNNTAEGMENFQHKITYKRRVFINDVIDTKSNNEKYILLAKD